MHVLLNRCNSFVYSSTWLMPIVRRDLVTPSPYSTPHRVTLKPKRTEYPPGLLMRYDTHIKKEERRNKTKLSEEARSMLRGTRNPPTYKRVLWHIGTYGIRVGKCIDGYWICLPLHTGSCNRLKGAYNRFCSSDFDVSFRRLVKYTRILPADRYITSQIQIEEFRRHHVTTRFPSI